MTEPKALYRLHLQIPDAPDEERLATLLAEHVPWGWEERLTDAGTELSIHCHSLEHLERVRQRMLAELPRAEALIEQTVDQNWDRAWRKYFRPRLVAETFLVLPAWERTHQAAPGQIPLVIEPKMAFGTGHHQTTALCLEALARLWGEQALRPGSVFLDLGTGSGILGIACALLGMTGLGLDLDPVAVENAAENSALNGLNRRFGLAVGSLASLRPNSRFDLVLANILAEPLIAMAPELAAHTAAKGRLVLSGLLREQEDSVAETYQKHGGRLDLVLRQGEWAAMIWTFEQLEPEKHVQPEAR
jgi:ribosomal protein L11 methyltransferase